MLPVPVYYAILALCTAYCWLRGAGPEKAGAAIIVVGSILSTLTFSAQVRFASVQAGIFVVDLGVLAALVAVALCAERFWPIFAAALQLIAATCHAVKLADPTVIGPVYAFFLAFWTYVILLLFVFGSRGHQRRLKRDGSDPSWTWEVASPAQPKSRWRG
ncbi:MAG TPA: hypothetical protein VGB08_09295 [Allosphingosinicella sp.]